MTTSKGNNGGSYWVPTLSISLVMILLGILVFVLLNARILSAHVKENLGFSIIVRDGVGEIEIKKLNKKLDTRDYVISSTYISKEEAANKFKATIGEDFEKVLGYNPLLPSIELKIKSEYTNADSLSVIENELLKDAIVQEVVYQKSLVDLVNNNIQKISMLLLGVAILLVVISFTLIRNTIHLMVYSRRFLIKTMQLVGAKSFFICKPFITDGFWYGLLAGLIANAVLMGILLLLQREMGEVVNLMDKNILIATVVFVLLFGVLLSMFSAWSSAKSYIRRNIDDLYNI